MKDRRHSLSDPQYAVMVWTRYRRIMRWMLIASMIALFMAIGWLKQAGNPLPIYTLITLVAGVGIAALVIGGLIGIALLASWRVDRTTSSALSDTLNDR